MHDLESRLGDLYDAATEARHGDRLAAAAELLAGYLRHRPGHGWAWYLYGDALRRMGLRLEAERALARALDKLDDPTWPTLQLTQLNKDFGEYAAAATWYDRAVALPYARSHGWVWIMRGATWRG